MPEGPGTRATDPPSTDLPSTDPPTRRAPDPPSPGLPHLPAPLPRTVAPHLRPAPSSAPLRPAGPPRRPGHSQALPRHVPAGRGGSQAGPGSGTAAQSGRQAPAASVPGGSATLTLASPLHRAMGAGGARGRRWEAAPGRGAGRKGRAEPRPRWANGARLRSAAGRRSRPHRPAPAEGEECGAGRPAAAGGTGGRWALRGTALGVLGDRSARKATQPSVAELPGPGLGRVMGEKRG